MKKRICVALIVFLLGAALVLPPVAVDVHLVLSRAGGYGWRPTWAWQQLVQGGNALKFYGFFVAGLVLALFWAVASSPSVQYRSGMYHVAPGINIPQPTGQGQYGTAWWAAPKELFQIYTAARVKKKLLKELLEAGDKDYQEVDHANIKID